MSRRNNRLIILIMILTTLSLFWGCSQPENVLSDIGNSRLTLITERLPALPSGMVYELWVTDINSSDVSLGKFSYDHVNRMYFEPYDTGDTIAPVERSNVFWLEDDLLKQYEDENELHYWFTSIFVSVETFPVDNNGADHGPIMLHDVVTDPSDDQIEMRFQNKVTTDPLSDATVRFNMETVSDGNNYTSSLGQGLWFSTYRLDFLYLPDTTSIDIVLVSDTIEAEISIIYDEFGDSIGYEILNTEDIYKKTILSVDTAYLDSTIVTFGADSIYLDSDTLWHKRYAVEFEWDSLTENHTAPYVITTYYPENIVYDTVWVALNLFEQDDFALPDYGDDWKYKGWIVSSTAVASPSNVSLSSLIPDRFTPPAWKYNSPVNELIPGDDGVLVSTGTFSVVDDPDDANPFVLNPLLVPPYPGEDFVNAIKLDSAYGTGLTEKFDFLPSGTNYGTAFITLEPSNFNGNTNFPLIVFGKRLPSSKGDANVDNSAEWTDFDMWNWSQTVETDLIGFPQITVEVERF